MARDYKRDAQGQFAGGGSSSKAKSPTKATPKPAAKTAAPKPTAKAAAKPTRQERSASLGEKIGNKLVSPERKEFRRKMTLESRQYDREINSPKYDYPNGDRAAHLASTKRRDEIKAQFKAAQAAKKSKKKS